MKNTPSEDHRKKGEKIITTTTTTTTTTTSNWTNDYKISKKGIVLILEFFFHN